MNRRNVGSRFERKAEHFLISQGYRILERNFRSFCGEIDLIGMDGDVLVFVEVKFRTGDFYGNPAEAVNRQKITHIVRTAQYYLLSHGYYEPGRMPVCRFDVVSILGEEITLLKNAFASPL